MIPSLIFSLCFGLIMGSFLNMLVYRLPRRMSIAFPASHCPLCGTALGWRNNIPLLSYILLRGKCAACKGKISPRYPITELTLALLFCLIFLQSGGTLYTAKMWLFAFLLAGAAFTDVETRLAEREFECGVIPDTYTIGGVICGYIWALTAPQAGTGMYDAIAGSGAGFFILMVPGYIYTLIRKVEGIGIGDALLMSCVGAFLGLKAVLEIFTLSSVIGMAIGIVIVLEKRDKNYQIPFAPAIALAALIYVLTDNYLDIYNLVLRMLL